MLKKPIPSAQSQTVRPWRVLSEGSSIRIMAVMSNRASAPTVIRVAAIVIGANPSSAMETAIKEDPQIRPRISSLIQLMAPMVLLI